MADETHLEASVDLREYIAVLKARRWIIIAATVLVLGATIAFTALQTPLYSAQAEALVEPVGSLPYLQPGDVETQQQVASSGPVADLVRKDLDYPGTGKQLLSNLQVEAITETQVLKLTYTSPNPKFAAAAVNSFASNFVKYRHDQAVQTQRADERAVRQRLNAASNQLNDLTAKINDARRSKDQALINTLETQRNVLIARLGVLQQRLDDVQTQATGQLQGGQVIETASVPGSPSSPNLVVNVILGLLLGIVIGVALAFLRERLDDRFRGRTDVERTLGVPALVAIPRYRRTATTNVTMVTDRRAAEAYKTLRTNLLFLTAQQGIRSVLLTSPEAEEGKTTTVANLAHAFAQAGKRVIAVSADLRRPALADHFGLQDSERERGLSTWLIGQEDEPWGMLQDPGIPNLRLVPSGPVPPNPAELLASNRMSQLIALLEANSDIVLIDSPPVIAVADTLTVATHAGGVTLVIDAAETHRSAAVHAKNELERVGGRMIGCVLNALDPTDSPYFSDYYYYYSSTASGAVSTNGGARPDGSSRKLRTMLGRRR